MEFIFIGNTFLDKSTIVVWPQIKIEYEFINTMRYSFNVSELSGLSGSTV